MQQKHLKRKGMSLLEIIISIAVYAVLALLLAEIMTLVNSTMRSTEQLNNRLSYEAKYADNLLTVDADGTPFARLEENALMDDGSTQSVPKVKVSIQYDVDKTKEVRDSNGRVVSITAEKVLQSNAEQKTADKLLRASEYTAAYDEKSPGTHFHDNTNYRYITFNKVGLQQSTYPGTSFPVRIHSLLPDGDKGGLEDTDVIVITGPVLDGMGNPVASRTFSGADLNGTNSSELIINVVNTSQKDGLEDPDHPGTYLPAKGENEGQLLIEIRRSNYVSATGKNLTLTATQPILQGSIDYVLAQGEDPDDPTPYMNYYNRYDAGFRGMTATAIANRNVFSQLEDAEKTERGIPLEPINYG